jgi:hypothetical protein
MPLTIRLTDLSTPQAWILPDASASSDGIMTALQAAQLAELVAGGGFAPGPFVRWSDLGFFDGFGSATAPFGVAESRVFGDEVELAGIAIAPIGGTAGNYHVTTLPLNQHPAAVRIIATAYQVGSNPAVAILVAIDDATGSLTGVPGAVVAGNINQEIPAGGALIFLDGLSYKL